MWWVLEDEGYVGGDLGYWGWWFVWEEVWCYYGCVVRVCVKGGVGGFGVFEVECGLGSLWGSGNYICVG